MISNRALEKELQSSHLQYRIRSMLTIVGIQVETDWMMMRVDQYLQLGEVEKPILKVEKKPEKEEIGSFWDTLKKFGRMLKQRKILGFLPFMIQAGLFQGYALGALYRLTAQVYKGTDKSEAFVKRMICIVQISFAVVAFTTSRVSKTISSDARYWAIKLSSILLMAIMLYRPIC